MHCAHCGLDYSPGEHCLCDTQTAAAHDPRDSSDKAHSVLEYPGETDAFCSLSLDPGRGGIP
jgi:hypothetical protein